MREVRIGLWVAVACVIGVAAYLFYSYPSTIQADALSLEGNPQSTENPILTLATTQPGPLAPGQLDNKTVGELPTDVQPSPTQSVPLVSPDIDTPIPSKPISDRKPLRRTPDREILVGYPKFVEWYVADAIAHIEGRSEDRIDELREDAQVERDTLRADVVTGYFAGEGQFDDDTYRLSRIDRMYRLLGYDTVDSEGFLLGFRRGVSDVLTDAGPRDSEQTFEHDRAMARTIDHLRNQSNLFATASASGYEAGRAAGATIREARERAKLQSQETVARLELETAQAQLKAEELKAKREQASE